MSSHDSPIAKPFDMSDPGLLAAARSLLDLPPELPAPELRAVLLKRLADDEFVPDDSVIPAVLLLSGASLSQKMLSETAAVAAQSQLQSLREHFSEWTPSERRQAIGALQTYAEVVPGLTRQIKVLQPGLDVELPSPQGMSPIGFQLAEQALALFVLPPARRLAARVEYFNKTKPSQEWVDAVSEALSQQPALFQLVPDFEKELRRQQSDISERRPQLSAATSGLSLETFQQTVSTTGQGITDSHFETFHQTVALHKGWTPKKEAFGGFFFKNVSPWWSVFFVVSLLIRAFFSANPISHSGPASNFSQQTVTMPQGITMDPTPDKPNRPLPSGLTTSRPTEDFTRARTIGSSPLDETVAYPMMLGLYLQQRERAYQQPGGVALSKQEAENEATILIGLLSKFDRFVASGYSPARPIAESIDSLREIIEMVKSAANSRSIITIVTPRKRHSPTSSVKDFRPSEALEKLLGIKAPVVNGVDFGKELGTEADLKNPERVTELLTQRAAAYRSSSKVVFTPLMMEREVHKLERLLLAHSELTRQDETFSAEAEQAAFLLRLLADQMQSDLDTGNSNSKFGPSKTVINTESER